MSVTNPIDLIQTLDDAKNALRDWNNAGVVLTENQLQQIIGKMSGKLVGSEVTLLYSGDIVVGKNPDGSPIKVKSWQVAEAIGQNSGGKVTTMLQTDVGKLLTNGIFRQAVQNTAQANGTTFERLFYGEDALGNRVNNNSLSDFASKQFVSQIEGKVQIVAGDVSPTSIFSQTEFPEIVSNNKITAVDGISKGDIDLRFGELIYSGNSFDDAVSNIRQDITQQSYVNTESNIKIIPPSNSGSHVGGIDTSDFFGKEPSAPHINTIPNGTTGIISLADNFDIGRLNPAIDVLGKLGTAGDILAVTIAVFQANEAYAAGDTAGAIQIMEDWAAEFTIPALVAGSGEAVAARLAANDNYIDSIVRMVKIA